MMAETRPPNQRSRPLLRVMEAITIMRIAGMRGDDGKKQDDADVQPRGGASPPPREPEPDRLVGHDPDEQDGDQRVGDAGTAHHDGGRLDRRLAGEDEERDDRRGDGAEHDQEAEGARYAPALDRGIGSGCANRGRHAFFC